VKDCLERNENSAAPRFTGPQNRFFSTAASPAMLAMERPREYEENNMKALGNEALPLNNINSPKND